MRKLLAIGATAALFVPALAFAAYNDVTLTTDAIISTDNGSLTVSGQSAVIESIIVNSTGFTATMPINSIIEVTSGDRYSFSVDDQDVIADEACGSSSSSVEISNLKSVTKTVTVTLSATVCNNGGSGGGGGGGGGGSSSSSNTTTTPAPTTSTTVTLSGNVNALLTQLRSLIQLYISLGGSVTPQMAALAGTGSAGASSGAFTRDLQVGSTGDDVKALQVYLNTHGYAVASTGPGSKGSETTTFGGATRAALIKLQIAAGISPAAGFFGPKTRAYVNAHP